MSDMISDYEMLSPEEWLEKYEYLEEDILEEMEI